GLSIGQATDIRTRHVTLSPSGERVAAVVLGTGQNTGDDTNDHLCLWNIKTKKELARLGSVTRRTAGLLAFTPDSKRLVCSWEKSIEVWDVKTRKVVKTIKKKPEGNGVLSSDGKSVILGGKDIVVYDLTTGKEKARFKPPSLVRRLAVSPDGKWLATLHYKGEWLCFWDLPKGKVLKTIPATGRHIGEALAFSPDSKKLVADAGRLIGLEVYDIATQKLVKRYDKQRRAMPVLDAKDVHFTPDGKSVVMVGFGFGAGIMLWD